MIELKYMMPGSVRLLFLLALTVLVACSKSPEAQFKSMECAQTPMPEYDGQYVSLLDDETGEVLRDTLVEKIEKTRNVFKPCRQYIYSAIYKDKNGALISDSRVWMMATGNRWEYQPEMQDEVVFQYAFSEEQFAEIKEFAVNKALSQHQQFVPESTTGIIENVDVVWMHPFRSNQYHFTEVAAFPYVRLPLEIGKSWTDRLQIGEGWGDWENTNVYSEYEIADRATVSTPYREFANCWYIETTSSASFGNSQHNFWFDENYGFVKMEYVNYEGQSLVFELIEVIES